MDTVFIAFGSNVGNRLDYCDRAMTLLSLLPGSRLVAASSLYETEPVADERSRPGSGWCLNGVVQLETDIAPPKLLEVCREIERALDRDQHDRGGPRTIDLDILFYGDRVVKDGDVEIPHPRLHLRRFVLLPLAELHPHRRHPVLGRTVTELLKALPDGPVVRRLETAAGGRYGTRPACSPPAR